MQSGDLIRFYGTDLVQHKNIHFLDEVYWDHEKKQSFWTLTDIITYETKKIIGGSKSKYGHQNFRKLNTSELRDFKIKKIRKKI